jgi:hypothetical protein
MPEGEFISDEPSQEVKTELTLPAGASESGNLNEDSTAALIAQLAEELGIDPKYIFIGDLSATDDQGMRVLASGLGMQITILSDEGGEVAARLAALASSEEFWNGVNAKLLADNVPALVTGGRLEVEMAEMACNEGFELDNTIMNTCLAVAMKCPAGTFASAGSGACTFCPVGKYTDVSGAYACDSCDPGTHVEIHGAVICEDCSNGKYQARSGASDCKICPQGKFMNDAGGALCSEPTSAKNCEPFCYHDYRSQVADLRVCVCARYC